MLEISLDGRSGAVGSPLIMPGPLLFDASSFLISRENRVNTQSAVIFGFICSHTLYRF
jgi:hypothetical protein